MVTWGGGAHVAAIYAGGLHHNKGTRLLWTPPLTASLLFVPDGDITHPSKSLAMNTVMRTGQGKGLPSKKVQEHCTM